MGDHQITGCIQVAEMLKTSNEVQMEAPSWKRQGSMNEYGKEQVQQGMDFVEKEGKTFEQTDGPPPSDFLYESTDTVFKFPPEGDLSSDLEDQSLSRRKLLGQRTDPVDGLAPKINVLLFEMPPYPPHRRRPSHRFSGSGGSSDKTEEGNRFSELDSASHSESEIDMDSPIWSSENANASGVLEAKPAARKTKGSSPVESSGENLSPIVPGQSSGIHSDLEVVGDRAYMQQEDGEYLERHEFNVQSRDGGTEEETEHVERHQRWSPDGATDEEVPKVEDSKEIDRSHSSSTEFKDEEVANSRDAERLQGNLENEARDDIRHSLSDKDPIEVGNDRYIGKVKSSLFDLSVLRIYDEDKCLEMRHDKEADYSTLSGNSSKGRNLESKADHEIALEEHPHENDIRHSLSDRHPIEAGNDRYIGKVQSKLFDLSVFGIYDENTYLEMRRGKDADYSTLRGNSSEGGNLESKKADHEIALEEHPHEIASQNFLSAEPDRTADGIAGILKHSNVPNVPEGDIEGTFTKTGCYSEMPLKAPQQDCNVTGSFSEEREVKKGADSNLGDVKEPMMQHRDVTVDKMDQMDMERLVSVTGKGENLNAHPLPSKQVRDAPRKPTSLRWKGKAVTDTQSLSSMEVVGGDRMEFDPGRGRERDAAVMQGAVLTDEHSFLDTGGKLGRAQWQKSHNQPDNRIFSFGRTRMIEDEVKLLERQKHESEDIVGPHRAALDRPLKGRFSNSDSFDQSDVLHMEGGLSNSNSFFGQLGVDRREHTTAFQGQALQPSRSVMDEGSNYSFTGATDYYSDHSARSREVIPHPHSTEQCLSEPYGLPVGINRASLFPVPSHGSMAPAPLQEQGFTHSAHHCVSPVCSLCIQQPYHMRQQMLQNMHPCAACRFQHSAAAYQPIHHDPHNMQLSSFSHPSLGQRETGFPPQSRRQNGSNIHRNYPSAVTEKPKLYPPLPGKGAPPYVVCEECNRTLRVPAYLPPNAGSIQKLQCGACGMVSKFSVPVQVSSQSSSKSSRSSTRDSAMNSYQVRNSPSRDKRYTDTTRVHSSEQISSLGPGKRLSASAQNLGGMARYSSGIHSQHEWVENRMLLQSNAATVTVADPVKESVHHGYHSTPLAGGVQGQGHFRSQVRYREGDSLHNNAGFYSEGYLSSPPFSASGSSPGGHHENIGQHRKVEALRRGRAGFGDRKMNHDLHAPLTLNEQDGSPFEAPSFSDGFFQKDSNENRSKFSSESLQGSVQHPFNESTCNEHVGRHQLTSKAGSWQNQSADVYFPNNGSRSTSAQLQKVPVAPGSPLIEHFTQDACDVGPGLRQRCSLQASGNGLLSAPWSPAPGSPLVDHLTHDISSGFNERSNERERPPASAQDVSRSGERERPPSAQDVRKRTKYYTGFIKRSLKVLGKGGKGGDNRQKVVVNGHLLTEAAVRKAEEKAGTIHPGSYWYDYQAGFWGVMGGPCLGILLPFIEEFNFPLAKDCAGGRTGILVNGRELHENDLTVLAKRGLPTTCGKVYILDIYGKVFDDASGQHLISLGSLAPSIEKMGCGYGMFQLPAQL